MIVPPIPPPFEELGNRRFSFYPAILNVEPNEWLFRKATWSEALVVNARSGIEVWIPRRFLGQASQVDDPVVIIGLNRELEYKGGAVWPNQKRVIEMPVAVNESPRAPEPATKDRASIVGIRVESTESRIGKMVAVALVAGILGCFLIVTAYRESAWRPHVTFTTKDQSYLDLSRNDDYFAIVRKLGTPAEDRWLSEVGEIQFRKLWYPERSYNVILMGSDRKAARYIGTLDANWHPVHAVEFRSGGDSFPFLRGLKRF